MNLSDSGIKNPSGDSGAHLLPGLEGTKRNLMATYPNSHNLRWLLEFFSVLDMTPNSYGNLTDNPSSTSQALRIQLHKDDMKVSKAKTVVKTVGYKLEIGFQDKETSSPSAEKEYELTLPKELLEKQEETLQKGSERYENLDFLWRYMTRHKISKRGLAADLGISPGAVFTWFKTDDIAISYLYRIKGIYNCRLFFNILKP